MLGPARVASSGPWAWSFLIGLSISIVVSLAWCALLARILHRRRTGAWKPQPGGRTAVQRAFRRHPGIALAVVTAIIAVACWGPLWPPDPAYHQWRLAHGTVYFTRKVRVDTGRETATYTVASMGDQNYALVANSSHRHIVSGDYLTMRCERVSRHVTPFAFECRVSGDSPNPEFASVLQQSGITP
ncbi:hypothetical protein [Allobranchiibius sp. GilTou73]|uniref:hypothetical protein n=1 Tax=Allobranchiibius sp. GilTou73 TaxID=2904523 RepID=UPI001F22739A|nr:hypothetical protein [Allobranchiibius sp. GilTou73]UIJ34510.1 hypothetical protein LVQ62_15585 [Allobranchiibius sp. GilTou73]